MAYCGYLDRHGIFYDCSQQEGPYKHNSWCEERGYDEDQLIEQEGWVKFSDVLFNRYIFCYYDGLSIPQIKWLRNHGYKIDDYDLFNKKGELKWSK